MTDMPYQEAVNFFAILFRGEHHTPKIKPWGNGWVISLAPSRLATWDFNDLTRLVFLAHDQCIRAEINSGGPSRVRIAIHQRSKRDGRMGERHPTIEDALKDWRITSAGNTGEQQP